MWEERKGRGRVVSLCRAILSQKLLKSSAPEMMLTITCCAASLPSLPKGRPSVVAHTHAQRGANRSGEEWWFSVGSLEGAPSGFPIL